MNRYCVLTGASLLALAKSICYIHLSVSIYSCHRSTYRGQTAYLSMSFSYPLRIDLIHFSVGRAEKPLIWLKKIPLRACM